jgi:DNA-binding transcriptional LysR family regulator
MVNLRDSLDNVERVAEWSFNCVCLLPAGHRLSCSSSPLDLRELKGEPIISIDPGFMMSICPDQESAEIFLNSTPVRVGVLPAAPAFVRRNVGIAIVDPFTAAYFAGAPDLVLRELKQHLRFELTLIRPVSRPPSLIAQKFSELATRTFTLWQKANWPS